MSAADRLAELRRQRALLKDHLDWLDAEIAAEEERAGVAAAPVATPHPAGTGAAVQSSSAAPIADDTAELDSHADAVMAKYRVASSDLEHDVRKGCFIYFFAALALLGLVVVGLYFALRR